MVQTPHLKFQMWIAVAFEAPRAIVDGPLWNTPSKKAVDELAQKPAR
jgi:hypothetical protein